MSQKNIDISKVIKKGRMKKELNQKQLAQFMGVLPSIVSKWENAHQIPKGDELLKLASYLDIVSDLFPGYEKMNYKATKTNDLQQEIKEIWKVIRQRNEEESDFKKIMLLLLKDKINADEKSNLEL